MFLEDESSQTIVFDIITGMMAKQFLQPAYVISHLLVPALSKLNKLAQEGKSVKYPQSLWKITMALLNTETEVSHRYTIPTDNDNSYLYLPARNTSFYS
jgi:hypothetical protein